MRKFANLIAIAAIAALVSPAMGASWENLFKAEVEPLVDVSWAVNHIGKLGVVFLDVGGERAGRSKADYLKSHIPGAIHTDYEVDGWRSTDQREIVGMFPIDDPAESQDVATGVETLIGGLGIDNDRHVVIVAAGKSADDMATATRIFWTFKVLGHDAVSILDGGMAAYEEDRNPATMQPRNPIETGAVNPVTMTFKASPRWEMIATKADVKKALLGDAVLVDSRSNDQFLGINRHPEVKRSGTIPGARNLPENWLTVNGTGKFRVGGDFLVLLQEAGVPTSGKVINFCNTGHEASLGWFVTHEILGNKQARIYDGSLAEWAADRALPLQTAVYLM
jgi:thiosulfate/3-mercaptopyruvate sulfurtransferase